MTPPQVASLLIVAGLLTSAAILSVLLLRRRKTIWQRFARRHGLQYDETTDGPVVKGTIEGRPFELGVQSRSSDTGALGVQVVCMSAPIDSFPDGLEISSAPGMIGQLQKSLDQEAVELGDSEFDSVALTKSSRPEHAAEYLTADRKQTIENLIRESSPGEVTIKDGRLTIEYRTMVSRIDQLEERSRLLLRRAAELDAARGA